MISGLVQLVLNSSGVVGRDWCRCSSEASSSREFRYLATDFGLWYQPSKKP
ncbi:hypothetical protein SynA1825c_02143 [Synechococcus sp. A18-25c]|nr:hypothetical protein SynA1825c_02143 [Synechococcus sp. A18-25c]